MKIFFFIFISIVLLSVFFLLFTYFSSYKKNFNLYNPYISLSVGNAVLKEPSTAAEVESEVPVNCVLSYGTYMVDQKHCDELTDIDASPNPDAEMVSCTLKDGTFSFTQRECEILKNASGSRDVMKTLD